MGAEVTLVAREKGDGKGKVDDVFNAEWAFGGKGGFVEIERCNSRKATERDKANTELRLGFN